jgi:hypothetical protein
MELSEIAGIVSAATAVIAIALSLYTILEGRKRAQQEREDRQAEIQQERQDRQAEIQQEREDRRQQIGRQLIRFLEDHRVIDKDRYGDVSEEERRHCVESILEIRKRLQFTIEELEGLKATSALPPLQDMQQACRTFLSTVRPDNSAEADTLAPVSWGDTLSVFQGVMRSRKTQLYDDYNVEPYNIEESSSEYDSPQ